MYTMNFAESDVHRGKEVLEYGTRADKMGGGVPKISEKC